MRGIMPLLYARDLPLGSHEVNTTICDSVTLENRSDTYVLITGVNHLTTDFYLSDTNIFPFRIEARSTRKVGICHRGNATGYFADTFTWQTDLEYEQLKAFSKVEARVVQKTSVGLHHRSDVKLWPNPAQASMRLQLPTEPVSLSAIIVDVRGATVMQPTLAKVREQELSIAALPSGTYQLILNLNEETVRLPFVKE
jgi:hypothetical protein